MDNLLTPEPGLVIWSGLTFLAVLALLAKFAWKPILGMVKEREENIASSLEKAKLAQQEYARVEAEKAKLKDEARAEREAILKEAREKAEAIMDNARKRSQEEVDKLLTEARAQIEKEKAGAIDELKNQVAKLSVDIAGLLIAENLKTDDKQEKLIEKYLSESNFN